MRLQRRSFIIVIAFFILALVGCAGPTPTPTPPPKCPESDPDPVFRELYDQLGGYETLGCLISPSFTYPDPETKRELLCQYTDAALLVYDPHSPESLKRRLAPIGANMGVAQPAVPRPVDPTVRWVEGHIIYDKFIGLYEQMGGMRYVGKPLTELRYNPDRGRYEQYFENVGFYTTTADGHEKVRMLAYGSWLCGSNCAEHAGFPIPGPFHAPAPEFAETIERLGADFIDFAISESYVTPDGYLEQVFDNIVLVADPNQPGMVFARAISPVLGILPDPPVPRSPDPESYFFPVHGELGYNIPKQFMDYIAQHGGLEITGQPITERKLGNNDVFRQCFENLCLLEDVSAPDYLRIQPEQLGHIYKKIPVSAVTATPSEGQITQALVQAPAAVQPTEPELIQPVPTAVESSQSGGQINIQVWVTSPMVASNQIQEVGVQVYENGIPMVGIEPDITLQFPDGSSRKYYMYPTGEDGQTRLQLEPIAAPNSTLIPYDVCIFLLGGQKLCVKDQYTIWDPPVPTP